MSRVGIRRCYGSLDGEAAGCASVVARNVMRDYAE
jgi:hypothetical protein